jgi:hypothetical protein
VTSSFLEVAGKSVSTILGGENAGYGEKESADELVIHHNEAGVQGEDEDQGRPY